MSDQEEPQIAVDDIVECFGETIGNGALAVTCPQGPMRVHAFAPSLVGAAGWALLKPLQGVPYVTATWPAHQIRKVD